MGQLSINAVFIHLFNWKTISTRWIYNTKHDKHGFEISVSNEEKEKGEGGSKPFIFR